MNFIVNKITYILERPLLMVMTLVLVLGVQIINLKKEVQSVKAEIRQLKVEKVSIVPIPVKQVLPLPSKELHIPNMPTNKLPKEEK